MYHQSLTQLPQTANPHVRGAFHVHSDRSHDGHITLQAIVAGAKANDLDFVIITDHNQDVQPAAVHDGVLVLWTSEIDNAAHGHVIPLIAAEKPLSGDIGDHRGDPDVLHRLRTAGAWPVLPHPSDRNTPWRGSMNDAGGLEIANAASSMRRAAGSLWLPLVPIAAAYVANPKLSLAQLVDRDQHALQLWDTSHHGMWVGLCGLNAHGLLPARHEFALWNMVLTVPLPAQADASTRARALLDAITHGQFHCVSGLFGHDPLFRFGAQRQNTWIAGPGEDVPQSDLDALTIIQPQTGDHTSQIVLLRNGEEIVRSTLPIMRYALPQPGTYRVEIHRPIPGLLFGERTVPVIYSNPIRITGSTK